ncbi:hypothetical protein, partial [Cellulomonas chitinilytica]|uniref:hypothetical protein n=1 Tax=Cellulomonas chitinilytica TaxID=398759 RepID=UPI001944DD1E
PARVAVSGAGATQPGFELFAPRVRPARLEVRDSPDRAVDNAVRELVVQGFVVAPQDVGAVLARQGSPWVARLVEIGDTGAAWRRGCLIDAVDVVTLGIAGTFLRRRIEHVVLVVTARATLSGTCELVVGPTRVPMAADDSLGSAGPRYATALERLAAGYDGAGALVGKPTSTPHVRDADCPACIPTATRLLRQAGVTVG